MKNKKMIPAGGNWKMPLKILSLKHPARSIICFDECLPAGRQVVFNL